MNLHLLFLAVFSTLLIAYSPSINAFEISRALGNETTTEAPKTTTTSTTTTASEPAELEDKCESDFFPCSDKIIGNLILIIGYGLVLGCAAKLISDGAEQMLDLNISPAIVGGVVLPVMGAVPDSVMIFVSGMGDKATAQDQIAVGMGTLAGSTILLLTVAWGVSLIVGRTDVIGEPFTDSVKCKDKECSSGFKLLRHGVEVSREVMFVAIGMMGTSLAYLIIQSGDWVFGARSKAVDQPEYVRKCALATMVISFTGFVCYLVYQVVSSMRGENPRVVIHEKIKKQRLMADAAHKFMMIGSAKFQDPSEEIERAAVSIGRLWKLRAKASMQHILADDEESADNDRGALVPHSSSVDVEEEEPKWKIAVNSLSRLIGGVAIVTIFSDPMCDALTAITDKNNPEYIPIPPFYVSFIVTPLCSNASELVSSILLAMQKEKDKVNMTYSQIYGACIMNNTLCLGVFCCLIFFRDLAWTFSAEVTIILLFEFVLGFVAIFFHRTYFLFLSLLILTFYPISLAIVFFLENVIGWG